MKKKFTLDHVTLNYVVGPCNGLPLIFIPAQIGTDHVSVKNEITCKAELIMVKRISVSQWKSQMNQAINKYNNAVRKYNGEVS